MSGIAVEIGRMGDRAQGPVAWMSGSDCARIVRMPGISVCVQADAGRLSSTGVSRRSDSMIAVEGFVLDRGPQGESLRLSMLDEFLSRGSECIREWRGSFRIAIHHDGTTWVINDHVGSRPWFKAVCADATCWSSSALPLADGIARRTLDGANALQFLAAGRFFAGGSPYRELRQMLPGHLHRFDEAGEHIEAWYRCDITGDHAGRDEEVLRDELKRLCDRAVLRHFHAAPAPSLMLSGGYDSRFLLNTLQDRIGPDHGVLTWLWCEHDDDPGSDLAWAKREAARLATPFHHLPAQGRVAERFAEMFDAQSGMTEQVFTHTDERAGCRRMALEFGRRTLLRADECFGPDGAPMRDREEALAKCGVPAVGPDAALLWAGKIGMHWREEREHHRQYLAAMADHPDDLRDTLYRIERLPALQAHLHSHRRPWLETHNPFLDQELLAFLSGLPASMRTDKRLFRRCFHHAFPTDGFATKPGTGFDWHRLDDPRSPARQRIVDGIRMLPPPFMRDWLIDHFDNAIRHRWLSNPFSPDQPPPLRLAIRACILGHWLQRWPIDA